MSKDSSPGWSPGPHWAIQSPEAQPHGLYRPRAGCPWLPQGHCPLWAQWITGTSSGGTSCLGSATLDQPPPPTPKLRFERETRTAANRQRWSSGPHWFATTWEQEGLLLALNQGQMSAAQRLASLEGLFSLTNLPRTSCLQAEAGSIRFGAGSDDETSLDTAHLSGYTPVLTGPEEPFH